LDELGSNTCFLIRNYQALDEFGCVVLVHGFYHRLKEFIGGHIGLPVTLLPGGSEEVEKFFERVVEIAG
jgi:hypothetical protein